MYDILELRGFHVVLSGDILKFVFAQYENTGGILKLCIRDIQPAQSIRVTDRGQEAVI